MTNTNFAATTCIQATALKLHSTKAELEQVLQQAQARLAAGLPPTEDAEMEWAASVRQQETLQDLKMQREQVGDLGGHNECCL